MSVSKSYFRPYDALSALLLLTVLAISAPAIAAQSFPRSSPEQQGVSSVAIRRFVEAADRDVETMHSFMLLRHGHVIAEGWWKPEAQHHRHTLYSLSKSFTSMAVGLAIAEKKLSLDDSVLKFFPDQAPKQPSQNLAKMRVRDLLTMSAGHSDEAPQQEREWTASFLAHPVPYEPGTHFLYNSPGSYMLSAILQQVTGETIRDYLTPRLFEPLGIASPRWDESPWGVSLGRSGLYLRTEDIAKFGQLLLQQGQWQGRQLVPSEWIQAATSKQVDNGDNPDSDWNQGYGFQFWRCRNNAFRGDGKAGQFCVVLPDQDAVLIMTADSNDLQSQLNFVWDELLPGFQDSPLPADNESTAQLKQTVANLQMRDKIRDDPFLAEVEERTFRWFWDAYRTDNGLFPDRAPSESFCSVAAIGFGLTGLGIGAERGYVTREQASQRVLRTLRFLNKLPSGEQATGVSGHRGFFYHFLESESGHRFRQNELSSIDTSLLMWGVLFCGEYFDRDDPVELEIRTLADQLFRRVEWSWMQPRAPLMAMAWTPEQGFGSADYTGFNEAMFLYVMALGSPTHPIDPESWDAFTKSYQWGKFHGQQYYQFSPLFGYQYSHVWIDPHDLADERLRSRGLDCFAHVRRALLANRAYCIANPGKFRDYGEHIWGLTACDGPARYDHRQDDAPRAFHTYWARGASLREVHDDGTIAPTAAGGSVPFAPAICRDALHSMVSRYGDRVYGPHGFVDAFNPSFHLADVQVERGTVDPQLGWFDIDHLGIDQGPILAGIENYRSGFVWKVMRKNRYLRTGLRRAGFTAAWLDD